MAHRVGLKTQVCCIWFVSVLLEPWLSMGLYLDEKKHNLSHIVVDDGELRC